MPIRSVAVLAAIVAATLLPSAVLAQYKNHTMGFDGAYGINIRPSVDDGTGNLVTIGNRPLRLFMGGRIGAEYNYKMSADHWWLDLRINLGLWTFGGSSSGDLNARFDAEATSTIGTVLSIMGAIGIRYVFLTDRFRPYIQLSLSYMRLASFMDSSNTCNELVCGSSTDTNYEAYFPHENVVGVHVQPGLEWVIARDFALHFYIDAATWFTLNSAPIENISPGAGVIFYL